MRLLILGGITISLAGVFGYLTFAERSAAERREPRHAEHADIDALKKSVVRLSREVDAHRARNIAQSEAVAQEEKIPAVQAAPQESDEDESTVDHSVPKDEEELRFAFDESPEDPKVAQETRHDVLAALEGDEFLRSAVREMECRGATCRVDLEMSDGASGRDIVQHLRDLSWEGPLTGGAKAGGDPNGPVVGVAYLSKPGTILRMPAGQAE